MDQNDSKPLPWQGDEHQGQGGSYLYDPATGKRTLVERTEDPKPEAADTAPNQE